MKSVPSLISFINTLGDAIADDVKQKRYFGADLH